MLERKRKRFFYFFFISSAFKLEAQHISCISYGEVPFVRMW